MRFLRSLHGSHHHTATKQDPHDCVIRSADPASDITLTSLIGGLGLVPSAQTTLTTRATVETVVRLVAAVLVQPVSPDSPPPKPTLRVVDFS